MDQHNHPCFYGVGPFPHFHNVGTSPLFFWELLWCLIPNNESAQSSMLPRCRNFSPLVRGIIMVLDTQQRISLLCFHSVGPFPHFHGLGTSPLLFWELLWCLIPNNRSTQSSMLPRCRTLSTLPRYRNFSPLVLEIFMVLGTQQRISTIVHTSTV